MPPIGIYPGKVPVKRLLGANGTGLSKGEWFLDVEREIVMDGRMERRLYHVIEGLVCSLIMLFIFWVFAKIVKLLFKKEIGSARYYTAAIILGFLLRQVVIVLLTNALQQK